MNQRLLHLILLTSLAASPAFAEEAAAPAAPAPTADTQERIEVTGSHIRRTDVEGVAPVQTVTREDLKKKAYDNLGDVVRDLGVNSFGSGTVSGNSTAPGNADISLRGLGADNTLVLLNGQRLPQDAVSGTVDINLIPMAAVDRIEILKDGASAIYGSDALGGVVNIITKKDFEGTEISISQTSPFANSFRNNGGRQTNLSVVNGINKEKFNIVTALNFKLDSPVYSADRPWSNNNKSNIGSPASYYSMDSSGNRTTKFQVPSTCPANLIAYTASGPHCQFKYSDFSEEAPKITQEGILSEAHYEFNSSWRGTARVNYVHRDAQTIAAPSPGDITIPAANVAQFNLTGTNPGQDVDAQTRLTALGPRITDVKTNSYGALVGATHQLGGDWQLDMNATFNLVHTNLQGLNGFALADGVASAVKSGAYNPFAATGAQGDASSAAYIPTEISQSLLTGVEAKAAGKIAEVGAGDVSLAVGLLANYANYSDQADSQTLAGNVLGNAGSAGGGHRSSEALYSELDVPLIEKKLELQAAGRFDHYSDFGGTVNPKLGLLYHANPSLLFRTSVGTGFRAPLLTELNAAKSVGFPTFIDAYGCSKDALNCTAQQYQVTSGGNANLKEETSKSLTFGTVFAPNGDFNIGTDWFMTKIENMPGIDLHDMTLAELNGANPAKYGVIVKRDTDGSLVSVVAPLQNLSAESIAGVDLSVNYSFGKFKLSTDQNQIFYYRVEGFPGAGYVDKLGWNGLPKWRNTSQIGFAPNGKNVMSLTSHTIPGQNNLANNGRISSLTTFDLSYTYKTKTWGDFSLGMINVIGTKPPVDSTAGTSPVNYSLYDPNGRQVVLGYRKML
jgi:iron complex outermembrane receptor protein